MANEVVNMQNPIESEGEDSEVQVVSKDESKIWSTEREKKYLLNSWKKSLKKEIDLQQHSPKKLGKPLEVNLVRRLGSIILKTK